jgi:chromosomal replication initiation ATPase DnaA
MTEKQLKEELEKNDVLVVQNICNTLSSHDVNIVKNLADFVASLCNVSKEKMFSSCIDIDVSHARWLFFYAYRYMTNDTYKKIGEMTEKVHGKRFSQIGIAKCVSMMEQLMEQHQVWKKKWLIIRKIIKEVNCNENFEYTITVNIPDELKDKIKVKTKRK